MKRLFILASAAIVALASCSKTQVVHNEAQEEIGFKAVTGAMTKAALGESSLTTMGVYAFDEQGEEYFEETSFSESETAGTWVATNASDKRYWPASGSLTFYVWTPFDTWKWKAENKTLTANVTELKDILYGESYFASPKAETGVPVKLNHAATKVTFKFTGETGVAALTDVTLNNIYTTGTCTVTYDTSVSIDWTTAEGEETSNEFLTSGEVELTTSSNDYEMLVVPPTTNTATLTFKYTLNGSPASYTVEADTIGEWVEGSHYTYTINIGATEIKIQPSVNGFTTDTDKDAME